MYHSLIQQMQQKRKTPRYIGVEALQRMYNGRRLTIVKVPRKIIKPSLLASIAKYLGITAELLMERNPISLLREVRDVAADGHTEFRRARVSISLSNGKHLGVRVIHEANVRKPIPRMEVY
ncbi:MAG TPA: hypothetical protein VK158_06700 [Acidobacteriota bacterium]|nr:hypothetical protein [Acidobacteriota bacterium]